MTPPGYPEKEQMMKKFLATLTLAAFALTVSPVFGQETKETPKKEHKKKGGKKKKEDKKEEKKG